MGPILGGCRRGPQAYDGPMNARPDLAAVRWPRLRAADVLGCAGALVLVAVIAVAVVRWRQGQVPPDLQAALWGLALVTGFCASAVLLVLWGQLTLRLGLSGSADAAADPRVVRQGRVQAAGDALVAPLSGRPCVAWFWRASATRRDGEVDVVCGGLAATAFDLVQAPRSTAVRVLPRLLDAPRRLQGPVVVERLRRHLAAATPAPGGVLGGLQQAAGLLSDMADQPLSTGTTYQRCWHDGRSLDGAAAWLIEETVLAIDTPAAVLACWSDAAQALVPSGRLHLPALAAASAEGLRQQRDSGPAADVQSPQQAVTAVVVLLLFGAGALALTGLLR